MRNQFDYGTVSPARSPLYIRSPLRTVTRVLALRYDAFKPHLAGLAQTSTIWAGSNGHASLYAGMAPHHPRPDLVARRLPPTLLKNVTFAPTRTTPT
jgi:hypothetical protein